MRCCVEDWHREQAFNCLRNSARVEAVRAVRMEFRGRQFACARLLALEMRNRSSGQKIQSDELNWTFFSYSVCSISP